MADNVTANAGTGGAVFATDDIAGVHYPITKVAFGALDSATLVSSGSPLPVTATIPLATSGGLSNDHLITAATTNAANIKASAGHVYEIDIFNNTGYPIFLKLHNTAGVPTAGAGVVYTVGVQAGTGKHVSFAGGLAFSVGIGRSVVQGIADADTTAVASNDASIDISYK